MSKQITIQELYAYIVENETVVANAYIAGVNIDTATLSKDNENEYGFQTAWGWYECKAKDLVTIKA